MTDISKMPAGVRNRHDQPVKMARFVQDVETRKILLAILIPLALVIRILTLVLNQEWNGWPSRGAMDSTVWGWVNLGLMVRRCRCVRN